MKISKILKKSFVFLAATALTALILSCGSTGVAPQLPEPPEEEPEAVEIEPPPPPPAPVVVVEEEPEEELVAEEPAVEPPEEEPAAEEPEPEPEPEEEPSDDEYARSVGDIEVSRDTFEHDKQAILDIISELNISMKDPNSNKSYNAWIQHVDQASIDYWKLRKNLQKAEKRLPVKGVRLQSLQDYFKQVFCPARRGREITEIRYISDTYVKAIQVQERQDIVYYYFNKVAGKWKVHIPPIEN